MTAGFSSVPYDVGCRQNTSEGHNEGTPKAIMKDPQPSISIRRLMIRGRLAAFIRRPGPPHVRVLNTEEVPADPG